MGCSGNIRGRSLGEVDDACVKADAIVDVMHRYVETPSRYGPTSQLVADRELVRRDV
jgi:hypothetical protein